jgi:hypothetical protein
MKKFIIATLAVLCFAMPAQAQFGRLLPPRDPNQGYKSGNDVLRLCAAADETQLLECLGFLEGASDLFMQERAEAGLAPCYPTDQGKIDQIAIQQNFIAYLIAHPERRPEQGAKLMRASIVARWCAK